MDIKEYISSGILESYILGLASQEEASILECVMKNNAEVKAAFEEAQITFEMLATSQAVAPPHDLKAKIWDKIQQDSVSVKDDNIVVKEENNISELPEQKEKDQSKTLGHSLQIERFDQPRSNFKNFAIAASVLFLISVGINLYWFNSQTETKKELADLKSSGQSQKLAMQDMEQKLKITSNPDMLKIALAGVDKHPDSKAVVFWDKNTKDVYLSANTLPKVPQGMQYQLWAISNGKPISAGMYSEDKDSKISLANIPDAQAFAITLEKEGGSDVPTIENMFVMGGV
ncbi:MULTISPECIES: anti-sigma factor domain-containing protein [Chryseobacterium]|uniref:Putative anti-sigmaE protein n=1 Tax=Chryseobacterium taihuense TaxID=1141221 RepID=A0A4U8WR86_9FLAO|nr:MULTISPECIES: anti-sigma factor [Chryseobacterium]QQV01738.1 anti-sigma factor [Chryseobacterium sp. FDAARGOS 1104]VFB05059.1 putative anti-sigmaE protein [Chryseobacterium taihuense]